jgi:SPX domain
MVSKGTTDSAKIRASNPSSEQQRPDSPESSLESSSLPPAAGTASLESLSSSATGWASAAAADYQDHGDKTGEESRAMGAAPEFLSEAAAAADPSSAEQCKEELGKSPGEIAFFKLLHTEFRKASYFFEKAQTEFEIREERVREGMNIMKQPNSILVNEKWSMLAKSIFRLYKDLLLLETYAIMAYCSFSKILKKHDKVTGHNTRGAFMVRDLLAKEK